MQLPVLVPGCCLLQPGPAANALRLLLACAAGISGKTGSKIFSTLNYLTIIYAFEKSFFAFIDNFQ